MWGGEGGREEGQTATQVRTLSQRQQGDETNLSFSAHSNCKGYIEVKEKSSNLKKLKVGFSLREHMPGSFYA